MMELLFGVLDELSELVGKAVVIPSGERCEVVRITVGGTPVRTDVQVRHDDGATSHWYAEDLQW